VTEGVLVIADDFASTENNQPVRQNVSITLATTPTPTRIVTHYAQTRPPLIASLDPRVGLAAGSKEIHRHEGRPAVPLDFNSLGESYGCDGGGDSTRPLAILSAREPLIELLEARTTPVLIVQ